MVALLYFKVKIIIHFFLVLEYGTKTEVVFCLSLSEFESRDESFRRVKCQGRLRLWVPKS